VSSVHCELVVASLAGPTIHVRDLNSTNGTYVDGERIQDSLLRPGQVLCLGTAELRLVTGDVPVVRIPKPEPPSAPVDTHLLDGQLACQNHPGTEAAVRCTHCDRVFCLDCVHSLGLEGRQRRLFCPCCSRPCEMLATKPPRRKGSIFARLTQTVRVWLDQVNRRAVRPGRRSRAKRASAARP
jgi:hypothetical protein